MNLFFFQVKWDHYDSGPYWHPKDNFRDLTDHKCKQQQIWSQETVVSVVNEVISVGCEVNKRHSTFNDFQPIIRNLKF